MRDSVIDEILRAEEEYDRIVREAHEEADRIVEEAKKKASEIIHEAIKSADEEGLKNLEEARADIAAPAEEKSPIKEESIEIKRSAVLRIADMLSEARI